MTHPDHPEGGDGPEPGRRPADEGHGGHGANGGHRPRRGTSEAARRADQRWLVTAGVLGLLLVLGVLWVVYTLTT
jgi:hypothetical protein